MQFEEQDEFQRQLAEIGRRNEFVDPDALIAQLAPAPVILPADADASASIEPSRNDIDSGRSIAETIEIEDQRQVPALSEETNPTPKLNPDEINSESTTESSKRDSAPVEHGIDYLKNLPEHELPRERMHELGPANISTSELLAIVLGSGTKGKNVKNVADNLLVMFDGLSGISKSSPFLMRQIKGVGDVKADVLTAAFELGRRVAEENAQNHDDGYGESLPNSEGIAFKVAKQFTSRLRDSAQEEMWVVMLDVRNRFRGKTRVYIGCCDQLVAKTGEILSRVVERNFPRYALVHNHPSGRGDPSGADISFTERLVKAGHLLDIELVDHVVLGEDMQTYVSMRHRGLVDFNAGTRSNRKIR